MSDRGTGAPEQKQTPPV